MRTIMTLVAALAAVFIVPAAWSDESRLFAVEIRIGPGWDADKAPAEQAFFREHSAQLRQLRNAGYIVMGARYSDVGLIVFRAASIEAIEELMRQDPSMEAGTFRFDVHPLNVFYPWRDQLEASTVPAGR